MARPRRGVLAPGLLLLPPGIGGRRSGAGEGVEPASSGLGSWSSFIMPRSLRRVPGIEAYVSAERFKSQICLCDGCVQSTRTAQVDEIEQIEYLRGLRISQAY